MLVCGQGFDAGGASISIDGKIIKNKDVSSISLVTYIIYNIGSISWILYGIYLKSFQMILFNTITSIFTLTILFMTIKYNLTKKNK